MQEMHKAFHRAELHLLDALTKGKGEVKTTYGDLLLYGLPTIGTALLQFSIIRADGVYSGSNARRWKTDWERSPQPIQIKLSALRGVRDKLPRGQYILAVSMYDRLGGQLMRWSKLLGSEWNGATLAIEHDGRFSSQELLFNQVQLSMLQ